MRGSGFIALPSGATACPLAASALRHSCISRSLLRGVPVTLVADLCDTSEREIRKHYAKLISHHADEIARRALLDTSAPAVVTLAERRP